MGVYMYYFLDKNAQFLREKVLSGVSKELPADPVGNHEISANGYGEETEVLVVRVAREGI